MGPGTARVGRLARAPAMHAATADPEGAAITLETAARKTSRVPCAAERPTPANTTRAASASMFVWKRKPYESFHKLPHTRLSKVEVGSTALKQLTHKPVSRPIRDRGHEPKPRPHQLRLLQGSCPL